MSQVGSRQGCMARGWIWSVPVLTMERPWLMGLFEVTPPVGEDLDFLRPSLSWIQNPELPSSSISSEIWRKVSSHPLTLSPANVMEQEPGTRICGVHGIRSGVPSASLGPGIWDWVGLVFGPAAAAL